MNTLKVTLLVVLALAVASCGAAPVNLDSQNPQAPAAGAQPGEAVGNAPEPNPSLNPPGAAVGTAPELNPTLNAPGPASAANDLQTGPTATPVPPATLNQAMDMLKDQPALSPEARQAMIAAAIQDLTKQFTDPLLVPEINSAEVTPVIWADENLGCTPEGASSTGLKLTPGYLIALQGIGKVYEYHAGMDQKVIYCPNPQPPVSGPEGLIESARQDLAKRLSIEAAGISLVESLRVTWADKDLGCSTSAIAPEIERTAGYRIILQAAGKNYEYHTDEGQSVIYCENPQAPIVGLEPEIQVAIKDLARRLSVDPAGISLVKSGPVTWPDGSLGCPQADMMYTQVLVPGYQIVLRSGEKLYEYHAGEARNFTYCENPQPPVQGID